MLSSPSLWAQDFGRNWIESVTRALEEKDAPLDPRPVSLQGFLGTVWYFDNNIFLEKNNIDSDSILVTWVRGRVDYAEPKVEATADLLLNYNAYTHVTESSTSEARFYGKVRYLTPMLSVELAELLRREADPTNITAALSRADRVVSDTLPMVALHLTSTWSLEAGADIQVVKFDDNPFNSLDNTNIRASLTGVQGVSENIELLYEGGLINIDYQDSDSPPDTDGYYVRAGLRGQITASLYLAALGGLTKVDSDSGTLSADQQSPDIELHARYEATQKAVLFGDYTRRLTFASGAASQRTDQVSVGIEYTCTEAFRTTGSIDYDRLHNTEHVERYVWNVALRGEYRIDPRWVADGGVTFRAGDVTHGASGGDFDDAIVHLGVAVTF